MKNADLSDVLCYLDRDGEYDIIDLDIANIDIVLRRVI